MENQTRKAGFFEAPPQTMFIFGLVAGIALTLLVQSAGAGIGTIGSAKADVPSAPVAAAPNGAAPTAPTTANVPGIAKDDYVRGNRKAKVVLYEYSDMQCPFCERHHTTMNALAEKYGNDIAWVYRHFPLTSIHPQAMPGALAAECVGEQKGDAGFFSFVDAVFAKQSAMGPALFDETAKNIGVDMGKYQSCVTSQKYLAKIEDQQQIAAGQGMGATPSTVVDGQLIEGAESLAKFTAIIDSLLK
jgi:protein-disulfide isomerase